MLGRSGLGVLGRDLVALTPSYIVPGLASLISVPLLFAALEARGYGLWALMYAIANGVPQATTNWLESLILRFGHRDARLLDRRTGIAAGFLTTLGGALLAWALIPGADARIVVATAVLTLGTGAYLIVVARLQSQLDFGSVSRVSTLRSVAGAAFAVAGAALTGEAVVAVVGMAAGFALGTADGYRLSRGPHPEPSPAPPPSDDARADEGFVRYGVASGAFALGQFVLSAGDRFILSAVRPLESVGVYAATYSIVDLAFRLAPSIVVTSVRQRLFRAWDEGDRGRAIALLGTGVAVIAWLSAWLIVAVVLLGPEVPALPIDAGLVGPISAGLACFVVANAIVIAYSAQVRQARAAANVVVAALANVALNLVLDPTLGASGAALATAVAYAIYLALNVAGLRDVIAISGRRGALALVTSGGTAVAAVVHPAVGPPPLLLAASALALTIPVIASIARSTISLGRRGSAGEPSPDRDG